MKKKFKRNKNFNINQKSFYFEDYLETSKNDKISQKDNFYNDRIYLLFFLFISLIFIFSIKIINISLNKIEIFSQQSSIKQYNSSRRDIVDRNEHIISPKI